MCPVVASLLRYFEDIFARHMTSGSVSDIFAGKYLVVWIWPLWMTCFTRAVTRKKSLRRMYGMDDPFQCHIYMHLSNAYIAIKHRKEALAHLHLDKQDA